MAGESRRIVIGVTVDQSFRLLEGFPQFLSREGWDVHLVSSPGAGLEKFSHESGITTHSLPMVRNPSPLRDLVALARWVRLLRRIEPDVVSVGTPKAGLLGSIAGAALRVPNRVYMLRGLRLETATGVGFAVLRFAEQVAARASHRVLAVSTSLRAKAIELNVAPASKIVVLGRGSSNGVDIAAFSRARYALSELQELSLRLGLKPGVPVIGFVGRMSVDKGLQVLTEARKLLSQRGTAHQLLVVGGSDTQPSVATKGEDLRSLSTVYTGHVPDPEIYFQVMDVLCLPTFREGFPNVVLEAGASGIPTVTTTATGAIDSVVDGRTGLIARVKSAAALSERLEEILTNAEQRERMGRAAFEFVNDHYSREIVWSLTEQFYASMVLNSSPARETRNDAAFRLGPDRPRSGE